MRCHICDTVINKPVYNAQLKAFEPCTICLEIINNVFEDPVIEAEDNSEITEDEILLDNTV
jgi:hypothetical protein